MTALAAIIFDFDGLVIDTETAEYDSIQEVFGRHGETLPRELWETFIGTTDHPHWSDILDTQLGGGAIDRDAVIAERRLIYAKLLELLDVNAGVVDLLDAADAAGVPCAVASSSPRSWVDGHLVDHGLRSRFQHLACGDEVPRTKPDPAVYRLAVDRLGVPADRVVAIEDSVNGCRAAVAAGLRVVAVPSPMTHRMDFSLADHVVPTLAGFGLADLEAVLAVSHP